MNWSSASDFFAMGGYGLYVWGAYGVTAALMLIDPILAASRHRRALQAPLDDDEDPADPIRMRAARIERDEVTA